MTVPVSFCSLCRASYPAGEDHLCVPVKDVIVDRVDPISGETYSTWAALVPKEDAE